MDGTGGMAAGGSGCPRSLETPPPRRVFGARYQTTTARRTAMRGGRTTSPSRDRPVPLGPLQGSSRRGNPRTPPRSRSLRPAARRRGRRLRSLSAGTTVWSAPWIAHAVPRRVWSEGANGRSCRTARAATAGVSYQSTWSGIVSGHSTSMITRIVAADTVVPTSPLGWPGYGLGPAKAAGAQNRVTKRDAPTSAPSTPTYGLSRPSGSGAGGAFPSTTWTSRPRGSTSSASLPSATRAESTSASGLLRHRRASSGALRRRHLRSLWKHREEASRTDTDTSGTTPEGESKCASARTQRPGSRCTHC